MKTQIRIVAAGLVALLFLTFSQPPAPSHAASGYKLPWPAGVAHKVSSYPHPCRGHCGTHFERRIDFSMGDSSNIDIVAAMAGEVEKIQEGYEGCSMDSSYSTRANTIEIKNINGNHDHYIHIAKGSATKAGIGVGSHVKQGQKIADAGNVGQTDCGLVLHFESVYDADRWSYVEITFDDVPGGSVEKRKDPYVSGNTYCTAPNGQYCANYYNNRDLSGGSGLSRFEDSVDYDWGNGGPDNGVANDNFSASWQGRFDFSAADYLFSATADDGIKVFLDGNVLIDGWKDQPLTTYLVKRAMTAGEHQVFVQYYENAGEAAARFWWGQGHAYRIRSVESGKYLSILGDPGEGAHITQNEWQDLASQKWYLEPSIGSYFMIRSAANNRCLDVVDESRADGADVIQWPCKDSDNQRWLFVDNDTWTTESNESRLPGRNLVLGAKHSDKALDVPGGTHESGVSIVQWSLNHGKNQQWVLEGVDVPTSIGAAPPPTSPGKLTRSRLYIDSLRNLNLEFCGVDVHQDVQVKGWRNQKPDLYDKTLRVDFGAAEQCQTASDLDGGGAVLRGYTYYSGVSLILGQAGQICHSNNGLCDSVYSP